MSNSRIFLFLCLSFIGGIFIDSFFVLHFFAIATALVSGILLISVFWEKKKLVVIGFCILFLIMGVWRHQLAEENILNNSLIKYNDSGQKIILIGSVSAEPDERETNLKLTIANIEIIQDYIQLIDGKILLTADKYSGYRYGDKLKITGFLLSPQVFDEFNYKDYLAKDGIYSVVYCPEIELVERGRGNFIYGRILDFKDKLREVILRNFSLPQSSILAAMLLGDKGRISQEWKEKLNYAGLRHLTAISGMHVAILTVILMSFLIGIGFWRHQAFYLSIILISVFIALTGFQSSAVRAGIMGGLFLFAQHIGRMNVSSRAIVFAAVLMLIYNPLLLRLDVGFQLSFLAMMGIIHLVPVFQNLLRKVPDFFQLKNILAMTISAQVFTLPILIYNFGYFSAVAPLTNILVVPFLPFIMGLGFIFILLGAIWSHLGWFFSLPLWLPLTYLIKITERFSDFSFSAYFVGISWFWLIIFYLILGFIVWRLKEKQKLKFLNY